MIGEPPSNAGAVHETVALPLPAVADPMVGASGTVAGVTSFDAADWELKPTVLIAATANVYVTLFVSPVRVCVVAVSLNTTEVCAVVPMYGVTS